MKELSVALMVIALIYSFVPVTAAADDITEYKACKVCGMDRAKHKSSRVLIEYALTYMVRAGAKDGWSEARSPPKLFEADRGAEESEKSFVDKDWSGERYFSEFKANSR